MKTKHLFPILIVVLAALTLAVVSAMAQDLPAGKQSPAAIEQGESASPAAEYTESEPNNTPGTADWLPAGHTISGVVNPVGDDDYFELSGLSNEYYVVDIDAARNGSALDAVVCLIGVRHSTGEEYVSCNDDSDGLDSMLVELVWPESDMSWYVSVKDLDDDGDPAFTYTLMVYQPLLVSATVNGNVAGLPFQKSDVLAHYDFPDGTEKWMLFFDASDLFLTQNLTGFLFESGYAEMTFAANQPLPGAGVTATPWDMVSLNDATFGPRTSGTLGIDFPGRANGLTTVGEKIDALSSGASGYWGISTVGVAAVPLGGGATLKAQDEDILTMIWESGFDWDSTLYFDGSLVPGLAVEDVTAASTGGRYAYLVIQGSGRVDGLVLNQKDIFIVDRDFNRALGYYWRAGQHHFPYNLDAIHLMGE